MEKEGEDEKHRGEEGEEDDTESIFLQAAKIRMDIEELVLAVHSQLSGKQSQANGNLVAHHTHDVEHIAGPSENNYLNDLNKLNIENSLLTKDNSTLRDKYQISSKKLIDLEKRADIISKLYEEEKSSVQALTKENHILSLQSSSFTTYLNSVQLGMQNQSNNVAKLQDLTVRLKLQLQDSVI